MVDCGTETLHTKRLVLRKITVDDVDAMFQNWAADPLVTQHVTWEPHADKAVTKYVIENWVKDYTRPHTYHWIVTQRDGGTPFGTISAVGKSLKNETCEIGYCYGSRWWGQGYGTEALRAVLSYLLWDVGFYLVEGKYLETNPASGRVMQKAGMKADGLLRERCADKQTGQRLGLHICSVTKNDFPVRN